MIAHRSIQQHLTTLIAFVVAMGLVACGGGGGAGSSPQTPPEPSVTFAIQGNPPTGFPGVVYSATLYVTGATGAVNLALATGSLPPGLALTNGPSGWSIAGTPTQAGSYTFTLRASDSAASPHSVTRDFTILIDGSRLVIVTPSMPGAVMGKAYKFKLDASGGTPPFTWSPGSNFPAWAKIDATTGEVSGTPDTWGTVSLNVAVKDSASPAQTASKNYFFFIAQPMEIQGNPSVATLGVPYSATLSLTGGWGTRTLEISGGTLPPGLKLGPNTYGYYQISGTPTQAGTYTATFKVSDTETPPQVVTRDITIVVDTALTILTDNLPDAIKGRAYTAKATLVNGVPPFTWSARWLPVSEGLSINSSTGEISGVPLLAVHYSPELTVSDSSSPVQIAKKTLQLRIYDNLSISCNPCSWDARIKEQFYGGASAWGGIPPLTWSLQSGSLPPGLSLQPNGTFTGVPTQTGTFKFGLQVQDAATPPQVYSQPYTIVVLPPMPMVQTQSLPGGAVGLPYAAKLIGSGGTPPFTWSVSSGTLPTGLALDPQGSIVGTPASSGDFDFSVRLTDSASPAQSASGNFRISIRPKPLGRNDQISHATPAGNGDTRASLSPYSEPLDIPNPDTDYFRILALGGSTLTVEAVTYPIYSFDTAIDTVLEIVDGNGIRLGACRNPEDDDAAAPIIADTTPDAFDDECLNRSGSKDWLLSHLDLQVPGKSGETTAVYAHVLDFRGDARPDKTYILRVSGAVDPLAISTTALKPASIGIAYDSTLAAAGGTAPLKWALAQGSGALPPGLTVAESGKITGTPTSEGTYAFTVQAADSGSPAQTTQRDFSITVNMPPRITSTDLPEGTTGVFYSYQIPVTGGTPPLYWGFMSEKWVAIRFDNGLLSGTTDLPGTYTGRVWVSDASGNGDSKTITLVINSGPLFIAPPDPPEAGVGIAYSAFLSAGGGRGGYTWSVLNGAMPPGLSLNTSTGEIHGIPTQAGTYTPTIQVSDSGQSTAQRTITLTVQP